MSLPAQIRNTIESINEQRKAQRTKKKELDKLIDQYLDPCKKDVIENPDGNLNGFYNLTEYIANNRSEVASKLTFIPEDVVNPILESFSLLGDEYHNKGNVRGAIGVFSKRIIIDFRNNVYRNSLNEEYEKQLKEVEKHSTDSDVWGFYEKNKNKGYEQLGSSIKPIVNRSKTKAKLKALELILKEKEIETNVLTSCENPLKKLVKGERLDEKETSMVKYAIITYLYNQFKLCRWHKLICMEFPNDKELKAKDPRDKNAIRKYVAKNYNQRIYG